MLKILFITNYKRDNQFSMEKYSSIHYKLIKNSKSILIESIPITNIFFQRSNNKYIRSINKYIFFPIYIFFKSFNYNLVHISDNGNAYLKFLIFRKTLITCHDLIPYRFPKNDLKNLIYRNLNRIGMRMSSAIIAVSKSTKRDFKKFISKKKSVEFIYTPYYEKKLKLKKSKKSSEIILLHIGSIFYKNRSLALEIINQLKHENYKLICIGKLNKKNLQYINKNNLSNIVIEKVNISEYNKIKIIKSSNFLLLTSQYEGYGFPVLEAYKYNIPVISSNKGSLKEIVSKNGLVKKYDCNHFVLKIKELKNNLKMKKKLIKNNTQILKTINNYKNYKNFYTNYYQNIYK